MAAVETTVSGMSGRYAQALFSLAKDTRQIDNVGSDLKTFGAMLAGSPDLQRLVRSPAFSVEDQGRAISALLSRAGIAGVAANFLRLIAAKRRLFAVQAMIADYAKLSDAHHHVVRASVTAAEPLSDNDMNALQAALNDVTGGQSVALDVRVDPAILGGLVVRLGSRMVDGSLRTKLNTLRTRMKEVG